jgi:hypothetical protein
LIEVLGFSFFLLVVVVTGESTGLVLQISKIETSQVAIGKNVSNAIIESFLRQKN